ncbi:MAG: LysM peptidoglycan-binding domain-containing protein [Acidobacteriaceae bacterium]
MTKILKYTLAVSISMLIVSACGAPGPQNQAPVPVSDVTQATTQSLIIGQPDVTTTPLPTRPAYSPGELVDYIAQTGDTLASLARRFHTSMEEILAANSFIPADATTMPPGMPMKMPVYYQPFWGSQYQIIPDSLFVNGPAQAGFDTSAFVAGQPGWLKGYTEYAFDGNRSGAEIIDYVAKNFSVSPRLFLALLEYQDGALSIPTMPEGIKPYLLGYHDWQHVGLYMQLVWAANLLNNAYYAWRSGDLLEFDHLNGRLERPDPWQNAATVALQYYFSQLVDGDQFARAIAQDGYALSYARLFGDPWQSSTPHIPGSLQQPAFDLPFQPGLTWAFTGGPHTGFGEGEPLAAIDFAPGAVASGCIPTDEFATAVAPGVIARSEAGAVVLDLDGDGDERTGWVVFYFHMETRDRVPLGKTVNSGDPIGHPSCEGGRTTGTHVHLARKYNGEWIPADSIIPFNLNGWVAHNGSIEYQGTLTRAGRTITACTCSDEDSQITANK